MGEGKQAALAGAALSGDARDLHGQGTRRGDGAEGAERSMCGGGVDGRFDRGGNDNSRRGWVTARAAGKHTKGD